MYLFCLCVSFVCACLVLAASVVWRRLSSVVAAKDELHRMLAEDELREAVLLVFANKQDLPNAMPVNKITERLGLNTLRHRQWYDALPHTRTHPHTTLT
jgi:hypothetical protein